MITPVRAFRQGRWVVPSLLQGCRRGVAGSGRPVHLLLCIADHFEPQWGEPPASVARERVDRWVREYPRQFGRFRDSDGRPPRHTFFYPPEQYEPGFLDSLTELCSGGFGEVEVHVHHDNDTADSFRQTLVDYRNLLVTQHGLLARRRGTGEAAYGFIHGNWALCNSRPDGRWCGVNNELAILRETGCYADFTLPSAPTPTQTARINSIYYASDKPGRPCSHQTGVDVGTGPAPDGSLMLIQGPLLFNWKRRKYGIVPRLENSCLQGNQHPTPERLDLWLKARVQVPQRPDWFFVKLYTHGAPEKNVGTILGEPMVRFHEALARRAAEDPNFHCHYVTAREMYNLARAAEAGWQGSVEGARDFELLPPDSLCSETRQERATHQIASGVGAF